MRPARPPFTTPAHAVKSEPGGRAYERVRPFARPITRTVKSAEKPQGLRPTRSPKSLANPRLTEKGNAPPFPPRGGERETGFTTQCSFAKVLLPANRRATRPPSPARGERETGFTTHTASPRYFVHEFEALSVPTQGNPTPPRNDM